MFWMGGGGESHIFVFLYNTLHLKFEAVHFSLCSGTRRGKPCEFPLIRMFFITSTNRRMKFGSNEKSIFYFPLNKNPEVDTEGPRLVQEMTNTVKKPDFGPAGGSRVWGVPGTRRIQVAPAGATSGNLHTALVFHGSISLIGAACYPIYFQPLMRLEEHKKEEPINRAGIVQEDLQPPGLKV